MADRALYWIALQLFNDCWELLVVNMQLKNGVGACRARQGDAQIATTDSEQDWCHAVTVNDGWDVLGVANTARFWASSCAAGFGDQCGCHIKTPKFERLVSV